MSSPKEAIFEAIIVSQDITGQPHVAPFGIRHREGKVHIAPYRPSKTLDNLLASGKATLNITDDVRVFAGALTHYPCWQLSQKDDAWVLDSALNYQQLRLSKVEQDAVRPSLYFDVTKTCILKPFQGYNRAQNAVVELAILISRINRIPLQEIEQTITTLEIQINKTAGERELQAWQWLCDYLKQHKGIK